MAIPKLFPTEKILALQQKIENEHGGDFSTLLTPTADDFELFGRYIQMFGMIELNLRNAIEVFFRAGLLEPGMNTKWYKLRSSELVPTLTKAINQMGEDREDTVESIEKFNEIELRRSIRNLLAHWAIMRIPDEDAIVVFSKDGGDEKKISGQPHIQHNYMRTGYLFLADIRGLLYHMDGYGQWLAYKALEWRMRYCPEDSE